MTPRMPGTCFLWDVTHRGPAARDTSPGKGTSDGSRDERIDRSHNYRALRS